MSDTTTPRVTTERVRELVEAATPGPWRNNFNNTNPTIYGLWVDHDGLIGADGNGIVWSLFTEADGVLSTHASVDNAAIIAAAPDLAADLLDARATIDAMRAELAAARELRGVVTAEEHARAVREAWMVFCRPLYADRGRAASDADIAEHWRECDTRTRLVARLVRSGLTEAQAVALADGAA